MNLYNYEASVVRIVDGDTLDLVVSLGFNAYQKVRVRLVNVDTPEVYGVKHGSEEHTKGVKASEFTSRWVTLNSTPVVVGTVGGESVVENRVLLQSFKGETGKYGRWLGVIYSLDAEHCLNDDLVEAGHATVIEDV